MGHADVTAVVVIKTRQGVRQLVECPNCHASVRVSSRAGFVRVVCRCGYVAQAVDTVSLSEKLNKTRGDKHWLKNTFVI